MLPKLRLQTEYTGQPGSGKGAPSAGAEAREMMPGMMGPGMHGVAGEEYRRTTDNKGEPRYRLPAWMLNSPGARRHWQRC